MASHLKLFLLAALFATFVSEHSFSASVFLSIDCGASDTYKDENSISWIGDDTLIQNGESKEVQYSSTASRPLTTLRVFTTRKKNCYNIKVDAGERVLVRASFLYGSYDEKESPPVFDLHFDGNFWATVNTSSWDVVSHEAIYVVRGNGTSICVAQTQPGQFPFISAIEVRSLDPKMYSHVDPNHALLSALRAAWGGNETIRYPDDPYDRIWIPATGLLLTNVQNEAMKIDVAVDDSPPPAVLKNAVATSGTLWSIVFDTYLPKKPTPIYVATYYSEVTVLNATDKRSFQLYIDEKAVSDPIVPPFGSASEVVTTNTVASASNNFSLRSTTDSTLPPLFNAMEIYTVTDPLTNGTHAKDVEGGLALLTSGFDVLKDWGGDPCLPSPYTWDWVQCSFDPIPRVTALNLSGYGLFGSLPDFSSMDALQTIDLSDNSLTGQIPEFLGLFPSLSLLNLANNRFNGTIPSSLSENSKLELVVTGNCFNETSCTITKPPSKTPPVPTTKSSSPTAGAPPFTPPPPDLAAVIPDLAQASPSQFQNILTSPSQSQNNLTSGNIKTSNQLAIILGTTVQLSLLLILNE